MTTVEVAAIRTWPRRRHSARRRPPGFRHRSIRQHNAQSGLAAISREKTRKRSKKFENAIDIPSPQTRSYRTFSLHYVYIKFSNFDLWCRTIFSIFKRLHRLLPT